MARKARDYKAEYARRVANATARGKTRAQARGHANEPVERRERRQRIRAQYGVSPERLSRLRRAAAEHVETQLRAAGTVRPGSPDRDRIDSGMRRLSGEALIAAGQLDAQEIKARAGYSYQMLILEFPEYENDDEINPFWYNP